MTTTIRRAELEMQMREAKQAFSAVVVTSMNGDKQDPEAAQKALDAVNGIRRELAALDREPPSPRAEPLRDSPIRPESTALPTGYSE